MPKRRAFPVLVASLLIAAGCGGEETASEIPEERLDDALLTVDDLGSDWTEDLRSVFTSRREVPPSFDPAGWCPKAQVEVSSLDDIVRLAGDAGAAAEFTHERRDEQRMFHGVSQQVWSNADVREYFDILSKAFETCMGESWTPEPDQVVTVTPLESPELGDESLALNVAIETPGPDGAYMWKSRLVVVVIGSALMTVRDLDVQLADAEPFMDEEQWWALVDRAMGHFSSVVVDD